MAETLQYYGTGRRKSAIARVFLRPGSGEFKVNGKAFEEYFVTPSQRTSAKQPLVSTETAANFNVLANVCGGGVAGQADAVRLGITRALMEFNAELRKQPAALGICFDKAAHAPEKSSAPSTLEGIAGVLDSHPLLPEETPKHPDLAPVFERRVEPVEDGQALIAQAKRRVEEELDVGGRRGSTKCFAES